jgi:hypothetical protein
MSTEPEGQDDLLKGIYQDVKPLLAERPARKFMPWHKPRKQYIRLKQWCAEVRKLIKAIKLDEGDVLRYLGFPGEDFLDVRTLHSVCAPEKIWIRYLGFDSTASFSGQEFAFNLARHEVFQLGYINEHSRVLKARLEQVANERSLAYKYTSECHDFDVINIDLCDAVTSMSSEEQNLYFEALMKLAQLQVRGRTRPWILFLTTRVIRRQIDRNTKWKLFDCVLQNINQHPGFRSRVQDAIGADDAAIRHEIAGQEPLQHAAFVQVFCLSLGKWLLKAMMSGTPSLSVRLLKSYSYRVEIDEPDMLSLAFRFEPVIHPPIDRSGLTRASDPPTSPPSEQQLATDLIESILGIEDIDQKLANDPSLFQQMVKKSSDLLVTVRYDVTGYAEWAAKESWQTTARPAET